MATHLVLVLLGQTILVLRYICEVGERSFCVLSFFFWNESNFEYHLSFQILKYEIKLSSEFDSYDSEFLS